MYIRFPISSLHIMCTGLDSEEQYAVGQWIRLGRYGVYVFKVTNKEKLLLLVLKHGIEYDEVTVTNELNNDSTIVEYELHHVHQN